MVHDSARRIRASIGNANENSTSVTGPFRSDTYWDYDLLPATWFSVPTGASTPANPPGLQLDMRNASRRGRYFVQLTSRGQRPPLLTITDRNPGHHL